MKTYDEVIEFLSIKGCKGPSMRECIVCDAILGPEVVLDFYTVVMKCRMKRVCKSCFDQRPDIQKHWMG
jgi:hypothetical protein